ncbi:10406_t:CDS:2, partial [Racocetra fulgida]
SKEQGRLRVEEVKSRANAATNKQFAHVDLKTESAMNKPLKLNGESQEQGKLRVFEGKSRADVIKAAKYTVFIAWTGSMTQDGLKSLFGIDEIRYLPNKQFAHVDLKTEAAKKKALKLNGESQEQGKLRVEEGKPRNTEYNGHHKSIYGISRNELAEGRRAWQEYSHLQTI